MLVKLIEVIGQKFEVSAPTAPGAGASQVAVTAYQKAKRDADRRRKLLAKWFKAMKRITDGTKTGAAGEFRMQNRVRFAVQDLVELRNRGWVTRGLAEAKSGGGGKNKGTTDNDGWTSVTGGGGGGAAGGSSPASNQMTQNPSAAPQHKKKNKAARKAEKARQAALQRAAEEALRRKEVNKEAQGLADELYELDQDAERIRVQIDKHMSGPKQARNRQKARLRLKKLKGQRSKLKTLLKAARAKGPDAPEEPKPAAADAAAGGGGGAAAAGGSSPVVPDYGLDDDFFELPPLENQAKVKGMTNEFLQLKDFGEFSLSLSEMELKTDEAKASVLFFLLCHACESLSSSTKRQNLVDLIALLKHLVRTDVCMCVWMGVCVWSSFLRFVLCGVVLCEVFVRQNRGC